MRASLIFLALLLVVTGCHSYEARSYDVTVKNNSSGPITIWLTKDGPPYENGWLSPEDLAIESPRENEARTLGGVVVPEGKTAFTGSRPGKFESNTRAILRIYGGQLKFNELLASSSSSKNRIDMRLIPGRSSFLVTGDPNSIHVNPTDGAP